MSISQLSGLLKQHDEAKLAEFDQTRLNEIESKLELLAREIANNTNANVQNSAYIPYPQYTDPLFFEKINAKKEFNKTKAPPITKDADFDALVKDKCEASAFKLAPHQIFAKNFISPHTPYNSILLFHGVGVGKCFAQGTQIRMHDGLIKAVEHISIGEQVMGDDSSPRNVLSLARGMGYMFWVIPDHESGAVPYIVNEHHVLCLTDRLGNVYDVPITDYMSLSQEQQAMYYGFRNKVMFYKNSINYSSSTKRDIASAYSLGAMHQKHDNVTIISCAPPHLRASFMEGYIDHHGKFIHSIKKYVVHNDTDIMAIARSIGIICAEISANIMCMWGSRLFQLDTVNNRIPNNIRRRAQNEHSWHITIIPLGQGEYFGFSVDGNHRFLLGDGTVTHNSCTAISIAEQFAGGKVFKKPCLVLAPKNLK